MVWKVNSRSSCEQQGDCQYVSPELGGEITGPAASTVAGTVPFAVGTETEGSLMSPAETCGTSAMRPSMGSIGRSYTMTLADSLVRHMCPAYKPLLTCLVLSPTETRGRCLGQKPVGPCCCTCNVKHTWKAERPSLVKTL